MVPNLLKIHSETNQTILNGQNESKYTKMRKTCQDVRVVTKMQEIY